MKQMPGIGRLGRWAPATGFSRRMRIQTVQLSGFLSPGEGGDRFGTRRRAPPNIKY